jgi:hypothetical protein
LLIKAKLQHGKNENKNTGLLINCMDFVVVRRGGLAPQILVGFFSRGPLADLKKKKGQAQTENFQKSS